MIIRGATMHLAHDESNRALFLELALRANAVICCRFSPRQKAQVVNLVKENGNMTLAIGDGGNDVSMIQAAHIGVGIRGKEGLQAARASDFQINKFRALKRLLLVHGRYSYLRTSFIAQYSYYKSFLFCFYQISFGFLSGFSGSTLFNSYCVAAYNTLLFFPIVTYCFDQDLPPDMLMKYPSLYSDCAKDKFFSRRTYLVWMARGFYQGLVGFSITYLTYSGGYLRSSGDPIDYDTLGAATFTSYLWVQTLTIISESKYLPKLSIWIIWGFHAFAYFSMLLSNSIVSLNGFSPYYATTNAILDPITWLDNLLIVVVSMFPVIAIQYYMFNYHPSKLDILRLRRIMDGSSAAKDQEAV